ncbi:hypothetical protein LTS18_002165, partial [Coniosporium uncinatum]
MIPEIRRLLRPIYGKDEDGKAMLTDHPSVKDAENRPPIPGMGGMNSYFFTHEWPEAQDDHMSSCNRREADMIVAFFDYLVLNGMDVPQITVLTFYNGQRKAILCGLRRQPNLRAHGEAFKVVTVDSYQGEENDVVLLSLVRSNDMGKIGFLNVVNRVCVALSRAKRGFYMFGNGELLASESWLWAEVVKVLVGVKGEKPETGPVRRIGYRLPLVCQNHGRKTFIQEPDEFQELMLVGGCEI